MPTKKQIIVALHAIALLSAITGLVSGEVFATRDEALKKAFPASSTIERMDVFLSEEEAEKVAVMAGKKPDSKIFTFHQAVGTEGVIGYAIFKACILRTRPAVFMLVLSPDGRVDKIELLANHEPEAHVPGKLWFDRFIGKILDENLWPKKDIPAVTGATISVTAITQEVRVALAVFALMVGRPDSDKGTKPGDQ